MPRGKRKTALPVNGAPPKNMMQATRLAIQKMGRKVKPLAIVAFLKSEYNMDITASTASNYKGIILKEKKGRKGKGQADESDAAPVNKGGRKPDGIPIDDIEVVMGLVERIGAKKLHQLIDVFVK